MRLHQFIPANIEPILMGWEEFARKIWPGDEPSVRLLRDHAEVMLRAVVRDMQTAQTDQEQSDKAVGDGDISPASAGVDRTSNDHAIDRLESGFDLMAMVSEYRALRASVLNLWAAQETRDSEHQISDMTRFNEGLDQLLAGSIVSYTERIEHSREIFLGILGHDLRTPLHAVAMVADLLGNHGELSGLALKMATQIATSVREMERMIADLLDFTGTRLGAKMTVSRAPCDLQRICTDVLEEFRVVHPGRDFTVDFVDGMPGEWDSSRLRQLISNLLGNAVQHGSASTPIQLSLKSEANDVLLGVRNHGRPIPRDAIALIFDPLRRGQNNELSRPAGSIGLGLYIAREVAAAHGGSIHVTSNDAETVFLVRLPRAAVG